MMANAMVLAIFSDTALKMFMSSRKWRSGESWGSSCCSTQSREPPHETRRCDMAWRVSMQGCTSPQPNLARAVLALFGGPDGPLHRRERFQIERHRRAVVCAQLGGIADHAGH